MSKTGSLGTILAYGIGAVTGYLVMLCLGELSVALPFTGAFHVSATRFLGPATGYAIARGGGCPSCAPHAVLLAAVKRVPARGAASHSSPYGLHLVR